MKQYDNLSKGMLGRLVSNVKSKLASVAFSGKYSDLSDAPNPNNFVKKAGDVMSGTLETSGGFNAYSGFRAFKGGGMSYYDVTGRRRMWSGVDGDNKRMGLYSNDDNDYFVWRDDDGTHIDINTDMAGGEGKYIRSVRQENGKVVAEEAKGPHVELTQDEWNALPDTKYTDGVVYLIKDGDTEQEYDYPLSAQSVFYANQNSGLPAFDVQNAIDQLSCYEDVSDKFSVPEGTNLTSYNIYAYRIGNFVTFYGSVAGTITDSTVIFNLPSEWNIKNHVFFVAQNVGANYVTSIAEGVVNRDLKSLSVYSLGGDHSIAIQFSGIIPIEQTVTVPDPVEQSYLDITDQIMIPDGSPVYSHLGIVQNGVVQTIITVAGSTAAGTYTCSISDEYSPINTIGGSPVIWGDKNDNGNISAYVNKEGTIIIQVKTATVGALSISFVYPLKKPMASSPGIAVAKQELDYENMVVGQFTAVNQTYTIPSDGILQGFIVAADTGVAAGKISSNKRYIDVGRFGNGIISLIAPKTTTGNFIYQNGEAQVTKGEVITLTTKQNIDVFYYTFIPYKLVGG